MLSNSRSLQWLGFCALCVVVVTAIAIAWMFPGYDSQAALLGDIKRAERIPEQLQPFAAAPDEGTIIPYPRVPLMGSPENAASDNLLLNASFETGLSPWTVAGSTIAGTPTDLLAADGDNALQLLPPANDSGTVFQIVNLRPRTFYAFSALVFNPSDTDVLLEARDSVAGSEIADTVNTTEEFTWTTPSLTFISGANTSDVSVGIRCSAAAGSTVVLADQCSLYALSSTDYFPTNSITLNPDPEVAPVWYVNGKSATAVAEGYKSNESLEMPLVEGRSTILAGLVPTRKELLGRQVWLSALIKCEFEENEAPDIAISMRSPSVGDERVPSATFTGSGEWFELTLLVTLPHATAEQVDSTPFYVVQIEAVGRSHGRVLVDDVVLLGVPEDFSGGLALAQRS